MSTAAELSAGEAALRSCVDRFFEAKGDGWEEVFVPEEAFSTGTADVVSAADSAADQSAAGRQAAGEAALRAALNAAGEGGQVTDQQCAQGTEAVLAAVAEVRAKQPTGES